MKIATYNINNINSRLDVLLRWLEEAGPDIVCLQELKCENNKFPERQLKEAGYNAIWQGQKSWNGVAILAKSEIWELRKDLPGEDDEFTHSRYIEAFVDGIVRDPAGADFHRLLHNGSSDEACGSGNKYFRRTFF